MYTDEANGSSREQENTIDDTDTEILERPKRKVKLPERFGFKASAAIPFPITTSDQSSVSEAIQASPSEISLWKEAINDEFKNVLEKRTWKTIPTLDHRTVKPLPSHVLLKMKRNDLGNTAHFKVRVVDGENFQGQRKDFDIVFSLVADFTLALFTLHLCLSKGWEAHHIDVRLLLSTAMSIDIFMFDICIMSQPNARVILCTSLLKQCMDFVRLLFNRFQS